MDDLTFLRERIKPYADYTNDDTRRLADEQVRAYVGRALARLHERLQPTDDVGASLDRVLLRCQFADQAIVRVFDVDYFNATEIAAIRAADRRLITLAESADAVAGSDAGAYLAEVEAALDARAAVIKKCVVAAGLRGSG